MRYQRRNLLMLSERTPTILAADHHHRGTSDGRQKRSSVRSVKQRTDLPTMLLGRRPHHHGLKRLHEERILPAGLMDHRWQPAIG
jgi:hypothetical protein